MHHTGKRVTDLFLTDAGIAALKGERKWTKLYYYDINS